MPTLTISKIAASAAVKVSTVRYYERRGMLPPVTRSSSGYRLYSDETLRRLRFIRQAQDLGFSLREIAELLQLVTKDRPSARICEVSRAKIAAVDKRIRELKLFRARLQRLTATCSEQGTASECVIVKHLFA